MPVNRYLCPRLQRIQHTLTLIQSRSTQIKIHPLPLIRNCFPMKIRKQILIYCLYIHPVLFFKDNPCFLSIFSPNHLVHNTRVALDQLDDLHRDILVHVVGNGESQSTVPIHLDCHIHRLQHLFGRDTG